MISFHLKPCYWNRLRIFRNLWLQIPSRVRYRQKRYLPINKLRAHHTLHIISATPFHELSTTSVRSISSHPPPNHPPKPGTWTVIRCSLSHTNVLVFISYQTLLIHNISKYFKLFQHLYFNVWFVLVNVKRLSALTFEVYSRIDQFNILKYEYDMLWSK